MTQAFLLKPTVLENFFLAGHKMYDHYSKLFQMEL